MIDKTTSRREVLKAGMLAGVTGAVGILAAACTPASTGAPSATPSTSPSTSPSAAPGTSAADKANDIAVLNGAIGLENQAIYAYTAAINTLGSATDATSQAVVKIATAHRSNHQDHLAALQAAVTSLGGTPTAAQSTYDLSPYTDPTKSQSKLREGGLGSATQVAALALALEVDATIAYESAFSSLRNPALIVAAAGIAPDEASHATAIRAALGATPDGNGSTAFNATFWGTAPASGATANAGKTVPASLLQGGSSASTRNQWIYGF